MPEKRFFVRIRGKVMGPFGLPQLRSLRDRGQFRAFHEISEDRQAWSSATSLGELFPPDAAGRTYPEELPRTVTAEPSAPHPPRDEGWRYVDAEGQEQGPVPRATLLSLHQSGAVQDMTLVWRAGMSEWQPLASAGILPATPRKPIQGRPLAALDALPLFLTDPVGNLPRLCNELRPGAAFGLGFAFYLLAVLSAFVGVVLANELEGGSVFRGLTPVWREAVRAEVILKLAALVAIPMLSLTGAIALARIVTRSRGSFGTDTLIAGATWLPMGLPTPVLVLLGRNVELIMFLSLVLLILPILLLNSAFTRAMKLSDRGTVFATPVTLVLSVWLCKVIFVALFGHPGMMEPVSPFPDLHGL
jgi:hypothetical protein